MKKINLIFLLILLLSLTGCKEYGEKRIVKMLTITQQEISVIYYNYSTHEVQYDKVSKENAGIQNTIVDILKNDRYDLKLCQYCIVDEAIAKEQLTEVFSALNNSKFSPDINLVCTDNFINIEKYLQQTLIKNPIYNFDYRSNTINATLPLKKSENSKIIISDGKKNKIINETQYTILDILTNQSNSYRYNFYEKNQALSADLENATTSYGVKNNTLCIDIFARLVAYRGMSSGDKIKNDFLQILKKSIDSQVRGIYKQEILTDQYNLFWYNQVKPFSKEKEIKITINIK